MADRAATHLPADRLRRFLSEHHSHIRSGRFFSLPRPPLSIDQRNNAVSSATPLLQRHGFDLAPGAAK
ncbi:hypothetical protein IE4771_CH03925 [Rhizobium etli bv. mimosae str. IE4771]|uniref:Uncharacterized protein n=1 Tax=Rhizobium etli bv. mimosae str. IE4771 TaxID=1432050 RepID=A0A060I1B7_RHIET|nr:hypothetical protein IE4771_CH03925 [Rhizobium sp. IE4771]